MAAFVWTQSPVNPEKGNINLIGKKRWPHISGARAMHLVNGGRGAVTSLVQNNDPSYQDTLSSI